MALLARIVLGLTFVFSGFVKAVDPLGTVYKIQDYLQAFGWPFFMEYARAMAFCLIAFEMLLGVCLLSGRWRRAAAWTSAAFVLCLTALTLVVALTNPVSDCGCFGDAVHLTNWQTFEKNVVLLILSLLLLLGGEGLYRLPGRHSDLVVVLAGLLLPTFLMGQSLRHLPLVDFRPYRVGTYLPDKMKCPEGAPTDSVVFAYLLEKDGEVRSFSLEEYPSDSGWTFVDRTEKVVRKGCEPEIHDFELYLDGEDIAGSLLTDTAEVWLLVAHRLETANRRAVPAVKELSVLARERGIKLYLLTSSVAQTVGEWNFEYGLDLPVCVADDTMLKTVIRSNPGLVTLRNGSVTGKWAAPDLDKAVRMLRQIPEPDGFQAGNEACETDSAAPAKTANYREL